MAEGEKQWVAQWVDAIDIHKDGVPDSTTPELLLKKTLKEDLQMLWNRKSEWRITEAEYNRYANAAKAILETSGTGIREIKTAYEHEKAEVLKKTNTHLENLSQEIANKARKVRNVATDVYAWLKQELISGDTVQAFSSEEGNYLISIPDFERQLKSEPFENINSLAMKNYLTHLKSRGLLNKDVLEQKCGWPDWLLALSVIWGTKMEKDEHVRNALGKDGFGAKISANMRSAITGGVEHATERIFRDTIISRATQAGVEKDFLDKKGNALGYESMIAKLAERFRNKKITGAIVGDFFRKELQEGIDKKAKLQSEKKALLQNKTVRSMLQECSMEPTDAMKTLLDKNIHTLTKEENKQFFKLLQGTDITKLPKELQQLVETEKKLQLQEQSNTEFQGLIGSKSAQETVAANHNHKKSAQETAKALAPTIDRIRMKQDLEDRDSIYRETLAQVGASSVWELTRDPKKLTQAIALLEKKWLQDSRLYEDLKKYQALDTNLQKQEAREYIKATENISEEALLLQEKNGRTIGASAEELYARDVKQKKTTDFSVPSEVKTQEAEALREKGDFSLRLSTLPDNEKTPLQKVGDDTCFVTKDGDKYILSIHGQTEICTSQEEVKNTLDTYKFFHDMGLEPLISSMDSFLSAVKRTNPICPEFSIQKGILPGEQEKTLLHAVGKVLNLDMGDVMALGVGAIKDAFQKQVRAVGRGKTHSLLKHRWILNEQGEFSLENMNRALSGGKRVLQAT